MNKEFGNIDLVFRNGLKDYEVLPPEEVWSGIRPVIKVHRSFLLLKYAAVFITLVSISTLTYFIGRNAAVKTDDSLTSFSIVKADPIQNFKPDYKPQPSGQTAKLPDKRSRAVMAYPESSFISADNIIVAQEDDNILPKAKKETNKQFEQSFDAKVLYPNHAGQKSSINNRWSVSAMASPTYYSQIGSGHGDLSKKLAASETPMPSYSGGFAVSYRISKRISIQTGFLYASQGQRIEGVYSYAGYQLYAQSKGSSHFGIRTSSGTVISENADLFLAANSGDRIIANSGYAIDPTKSNLNYLGNEIIQSFNYLQMPVVIRYKIIDKDLDVNVIGGLSSDFLIKNDAFAWVNGSKLPVGETQGLNTLTLSSSFGMGMEYGITEKISLNLEPTFRYFINPSSEPLDPDLHHYSFGIFSGLSYKF
ncbi:MAG TPA: hypothetical protein VHO50_14510 [Bacteroidales bacterium]|nr:hypothetical protein [Bacteroidales bacterium]